MTGGFFSLSLIFVVHRCPPVHSPSTRAPTSTSYTAVHPVDGGQTDLSHTAWNAAANTEEGKSVLGTKAKISGANLFMRLNYWVVQLGVSILISPPTLSGVESPSSATIVCTNQAFTFKLDTALADNGGMFLIIEASPGQSMLSL